MADRDPRNGFLKPASRSALDRPAAAWSPLKGGGTRLPQERLSMRKIKEVLRLHSLGLSQQPDRPQLLHLARARFPSTCRPPQASRLELAGDGRTGTSGSWPPGCCPERAAPVRRGQHPPPDFAAIHQRTAAPQARHPAVALGGVSRDQHPDGYRYSRFCELYQRWRAKQDVVLRQEHRAGEKLFVDWAGDTIPVHDRKTGEPRPAVDLRRRAGRQQLHLRRGHAGRRAWRTGSARTSAPSSSSAACRRSSSRTIPRPASPRPAATSRI